ncbi:hypothetical protein SLEP1_g30362 [Rubroshorea leprosula]|uniref:Uncharacterized protein n=1 Tax=Rubroshorea leprosula TaxID=152421 RepID=A0AAV5K897_9ROSI|nr:hypothetical protein SLEP1_g30362 [Rubroshorea leprosula]
MVGECEFTDEVLVSDLFIGPRHAGVYIAPYYRQRARVYGAILPRKILSILKIILTTLIFTVPLFADIYLVGKVLVYRENFSHR